MGKDAAVEINSIRQINNTLSESFAKYKKETKLRFEEIVEID
jgi:hypothetical protein